MVIADRLELSTGQRVETLYLVLADRADIHARNQVGVSSKSGDVLWGCCIVAWRYFGEKEIGRDRVKETGRRRKGTATATATATKSIMSHTSSLQR